MLVDVLILTVVATLGAVVALDLQPPDAHRPSLVKVSHNSPVLKLPDMISVYGAPNMLFLADVVLIRPGGSMGRARPALDESIAVTDHITLNILALPARYVRLPVSRV